MAKDEELSGDVLVQVCLECGKEYTFGDDDKVPDDLVCEKCGNGVFRSFWAESEDDDVAADFRETTERDVGTTDDAGDVTRGDLHDLGQL